jgi:hypothetical protein
MGAIWRHVQNVEQQYIETKGQMKAEVEKLVFSVRRSSSSPDHLHVQNVALQRIWSALVPTPMMPNMV